MYSVDNNKIFGFIWIIVKKCFSYRHARNPVHRVYRISVVLCYTMIAMAITVIFYMFNKGEGKLTAAKHTSMVNVSAWLGVLMYFFLAKEFAVELFRFVRLAVSFSCPCYTYLLMRLKILIWPHFTMLIKLTQISNQTVYRYLI